MEEDSLNEFLASMFYLSFSCSSVPGKGWTTKCRDDITSTLYSTKIQTNDWQFVYKHISLSIVSPCFQIVLKVNQLAELHQHNPIQSLVSWMFVALPLLLHSLEPRHVRFLPLAANTKVEDRHLVNVILGYTMTIHFLQSKMYF